MIRKFKNFDAQEFISKKNALKEAVDNDENIMELPELKPDDPKEEDVITGTAVYDNPYLYKIARIMWKRLKNIGEFGICHDIVYLNNVPGIWFFGINGNDKNIVCCRNTNVKTISLFKHFEIGGTNVAEVTYSTEKFGFKDMIEQIIEDLKAPEAPVNEELIVEAGGFGDGYSDKNIANFKRFPWVDKQYMYDLLSKGKKGDAILQLKSGLDSGDRTVLRILSAFAPTGKATAGSAKYIVGLVQDIMSDRYSAMNKDFKDLVDEYQTKYKGGSPAIATSYGIEYEVSDVEAEEEEKVKALEAAHEADIDAKAKAYNDTINALQDVTRAMCNYVKQNGELSRDDKSIMSRRAVLLTGSGGIGKTHTIKDILKEKNMVENRDYVWISLDQTTSSALYSILYDYNGKLIVFDDAPKLFDGDYRIALWKNALQTDIEDCKIGYPKGETKEESVYNVRRLKGDRQRQYFVEIGHKSDDDRMEFFNREMKAKGLKIDSTRGSVSIAGIKGITHVKNLSGESYTDTEIQAILNDIEDAWKEEQENTKPRMPNTFIFRGVIVIISNESREKFISMVGPGNWEAIESRFENYDMSPEAEAIWRIMKKKILTEYNDNSIPDDLCSIPRAMTEEFIDEVERLLGANPLAKLTWRTIRAFGDVLRGAPGLKVWKHKLSQELYGQAL